MRFCHCQVKFPLFGTSYSLLEELVSNVNDDTDNGLSDRVRTLSTESDWTSDHSRAVSALEYPSFQLNKTGVQPGLCHDAGSESLDSIKVDTIKPQADRFVFPLITAYLFRLSALQERSLPVSKKAR